MNIQEYKDAEKRLTLMQDKEWVRTINRLKTFEYDDSKNFSIIYKQEKQRKNRSIGFHSVTFIEETYSFVFVSYGTDWETSELTDEIKDRTVLKDIDIIKLNQIDKPNLDDFFFLT